MKTFGTKEKFKDNPFYGMESMLNAFQQLPKVGSHPSKSTVVRYLTEAYKECVNDQQKELFYCLIFSLGEIANRNHNLFKKKGFKQVENGGSSLRKLFFYCLEWMLSYDNNTKEQFYKFIPIIGEYTNLGNLFLYQLRTDRFKGTVTEVMKLPIDIEQVTDYIAFTLKDAKTTDATHTLWAKFLPRPEFHKRTRKKVVLEGKAEYLSKKLNKPLSVGDKFSIKSTRQESTLEKEAWEYNLIAALSKKMGWEVISHAKNTEFVGLKNYKKKYLVNSESKLFSQKGILEFEKEKFISWVDSLPSGSRYNVQRRLLNKEGNSFVSTNKWITNNGEDLAKWYLEWQNRKLDAQKALASLSDEDKKSMTAKELKTLEKSAKVNTAGDTIVTILAKLLKGNFSQTEAEIVSNAIMNLIKLNVPVLIFADVSGSMGTNGAIIDGVRFSAFDLMTIAVTAFLLKNPDADLKSILGTFSRTTQIFADYDYYKAKNNGMHQNSWMYNNREWVKVKDKKLVDKTKSFIENYQNIRKLLSGLEFASTNIAAVSTTLKHWAEADEEFVNERKELIAKYPIHLYISDGDFNNLSSASQSLLQHRQNMKQWFGWDGLTVIWDVKQESFGDGEKFRGIPNTMYFGSANIGVLNQIFTNIHDLDIIDDYLPLQALHRSIRYEPVKELVIKKSSVKSSKKELI